MSEATRRGLDLTINRFTELAPQYFNWTTERGRAAIAAVATITAGEMTGHLSKIQTPADVDKFFFARGGRDNLMQGPLQLNQKWERFRQAAETPASYVRFIGEVLYGRTQLPKSRNTYFDLEGFARAFNENPKMDAKTMIELLRRAGITKTDWEGIYGNGASRIKEIWNAVTAVINNGVNPQATNPNLSGVQRIINQISKPGTQPQVKPEAKPSLPTPVPMDKPQPQTTGHEVRHEQQQGRGNIAEIIEYTPQVENTPPSIELE